MSLLGIGAFARAARLSPKALRLYDELGLLKPAHVDPVTGYRRYAPDQLEQARLVAWLRRIGMPLARIRTVCGLEPDAAAQEVRSYWARVESDTAARRDLAAFLVDHLTRKDPAMASPSTGTPSAPLNIRYAALSDQGLVRESNQDAAFAGSRVLAVADGFGRSGGPASAAAIDVFERLETEPVPAGDLLNSLEDAAERAGSAVRDVATADPAPATVGTTLTAMLWTGSQLALVHIGDSRAYLLRDGELFQITHDHTQVQALLDEGRLSADEAASHPQRALLLRALSGARPGDDGPDLRLHDAAAGDRYLLCSDGLSAVVPNERIGEMLAGTPDPEDVVRELVDLAREFGGPDNVSCVVADVG
ncbi:MerR family transcriptional regulator [Streptomyces luteolus]|uniref:MerR family transcriptional regulator n=1 Tax=Streptomyces luteolus TaxID=3043615 RepID=A0ABT6T5V4_9ACTN|nr:MerR family transcriptional regulator [Streptomyces sp. B-S-A12]MDI3422439.1 MerR family transcriptional regulator [Streptomyces sp. B-S-A12]